MQNGGGQSVELLFCWVSCRKYFRKGEMHQKVHKHIDMDESLYE
jgi:hypothetical protein